MDEAPVFMAVSTSARQLYLLLRCINFVAKVEVQITAEGLRFSAEESHVIQGLAFLEKTLFSSYTYNPQNSSTQLPPFQISLSALIETLQIFGVAEISSSNRSASGGFAPTYSAFNNPSLALGGTCRLSYHSAGAPLSITISESGVTTTCELTTYNLSTPHYDDSDDGIPLDRDALALKIIMRSTWLHDAITELSGTNPTILVLNASSLSPPYLALEGRGGPFGDSTVDFQPDSQRNSINSKKQPLITETFSVSPHTGAGGRVKQRYKFDLIRKAGRAMALASKVSLRQDVQGVLSLQFMIEVGDTGVGGGLNGNNSASGSGGGAASGGGGSALPNGVNGGRTSFVDFRFLPLVDEEADDDEDDGDEGEGDGEGDGEEEEDGTQS